MRPLVWIVATGVLLGWQQQRLSLLIAQTQERPSAASPLKVQSLPNAYRIHEKVISGGLPEGEAGFEALRNLGVRTVISVDGAKPDVSLARKYGLRYVHLPHGYDGVPDLRARELAKAVSELPGPIYIHCHHGKHRSPAAATIACIGAGLVPVNRGQAILVMAGTNKDYRGLYRDVEKAVRYPSQQLSQFQVTFPEVAKITPMADAMVRLSESMENLQRIVDSGWQPPPVRPKLVPVTEALLIREHFVELLRTDEVKQQTREFLEILKHSLQSSLELEKMLRQLPSGELSPATQQRLTLFHAAIRSDCKSCHTKYRDNLPAASGIQESKAKKK